MVPKPVSIMPKSSIMGALAGPSASYSRRRLVGFVKRKLQWEFWPAWAAYLPLIPYFLYLAVRHRSLTVFTASNPGIPAGGLVGESKSEILRGIEREPGFVATFELLTSSLSLAQRCARAAAFAQRCGWPVVLKPDVGERGAGVAIVRSVAALERYLAANPGDTIVQRYAPGLEFGIFYYRFPGEARGHIFSLTEKRFPMVTGDGRRSLRELILNDERAVCQAATYLRLMARDPEDVPASGAMVQLVEIGSHCRGAIFLDGGRLVTPALESAVDRVGQALTGFHFGRFDVRSESIADLQAGRFLILELNGVSAEAAHIYDPAVSIWQAYRTLFRQWKMAFEIGAANRQLGVRPASAREIIQLVRGRRRAD